MWTYSQNYRDQQAVYAYGRVHAVTTAAIKILYFMVIVLVNTK